MNRFSMTVGFVLFGAAIGSPTAWAQEPPKTETAPAKPAAEVREEFPESDDYLLGEGEAKGITVKTRSPEDPTKPAEKPKLFRQTVTFQTPTGKQTRTVFKLDPLLQNFGVSLLEADDALRAQLEIPAGEGVVVVTVRPSSLAHNADLRPNDVILSLAGKPAKNVAEVSKILLGLTREAIPVKLIRGGKTWQLSVVGPEHGILPEAPSEFWIGVSVTPVDGTLRAHLTTLPADAGLVANDVVKDSPAEAAGFKKNDILITLNESRPLQTREAMVAAIQGSQGKAVPAEILRGGKPLKLTVTPAKRSSSPKVAVFNLAEEIPGNFDTSNPKATLEFLQKVVKSGSTTFYQVGPPSISVQVDPQADKADGTAKNPVTASVKVMTAPDVASIDPQALQKQIHESIQLRVMTKPPASESPERIERIEAQLKDIKTKLELILETLTKAERK